MAVRVNKLGFRKRIPREGNLDVSMRDYQAAMMNNLTASWAGQWGTAAQTVYKNLATLRSRCREQVENNDYAKWFLTLLKTNVIGPQGFDYRPRPQDPGGQLDRLAGQALRASFKDWSKKRNCDLRKQISFLGIQRQFISNVATDGEVLCRIHRGREFGKYGFQLEMIDPGYLDINYFDTYAGTGNPVEMSIEYDSFGRAVAYHILKPARGQVETMHAGYYKSGVRERVPAEDIIHAFIPERIDQPRGIPWMATPLLRMNMQSGFEEGALVNARAGAGKMGFFKPSAELNKIFDQDSETGELIDQSDPGTWHQLPPGVELQEYDPTYPNNEFGTFSKAILRGIAAGLGVAYHTLANDLEGVNYSSGRLGSQNERDVWVMLQGWVKESFLDRVIEEWTTEQVTNGNIRIGNGTLRASQLDKYLMYDLQGRRWKGVDPAKDATANESDWGLKIKSLSGMIRERGDDPDEVWNEIAEDEAKLKALGIQVAVGTAPPQNEDEEKELPDSDGNTE